MASSMLRLAQQATTSTSTSVSSTTSTSTSTSTPTTTTATTIVVQRRPGRCRSSCRSHATPRSEGDVEGTTSETLQSRRLFLVSSASAAASAAAVVAAAGLTTLPFAANAFIEAAPGFRAHEDKLDGYSFLYPDDWIPVTTSGNDVFYRSPLDVDTNLFVDVSSPSSSKYTSVADLGTPQEAADRTLKQYLTELMSTRIGVRRSGEVLSAAARELTDDELARFGDDVTSSSSNRLYYDIVVRMRSLASRNQLAVSQAEVDAGDELEWERDFRAVLGVAGKRLYEFRLQSPTAGSRASASSPAAGRVDPAVLDAIARSFRCREVA